MESITIVLFLALAVNSSLSSLDMVFPSFFIMSIGLSYLLTIHTFLDCGRLFLIVVTLAVIEYIGFPIVKRGKKRGGAETHTPSLNQYILLKTEGQMTPLL